MEQFIKPELLADNCSSNHKENVSRNFTDEEMVELKKLLAEYHVQLSQRTKLVASIGKLLKEDIENPVEHIMAFLESYKMEGDTGTTELTNQINKLTTAINNKVIEVNETVYVFHYHNEGRAGVYASNGHLMYTRPLKHGENQATIFSLIKES